MAHPDPHSLASGAMPTDTKTMDYFEQKAHEVARTLGLTPHPKHWEPIAEALREVDRDTRHRCAEAVNAVHITTDHDPSWAIKDAHAACMNARPASGD